MSTTPGRPAEPGAGPDLGIPGPDLPAELPGREETLPERLGERVYGEGTEGIAAGEPDLKPDVEVPDETM